MNKVKLMGWASMLFLLIFTSCREDVIIDDSNQNTNSPAVVINSSIKVFVTDENEEQLENVKVTLGDDVLYTDVLGIARFENKKMNEAGQTITLSHTGHYELQKVFYPRLNTNITMKVKLMKKELTGVINSKNGGEVTTSKGAIVKLPANGVMYKDGSAYEGDVNVFARWLDPSSNGLDYIMPGNLRALNKNEEAVQLETYGMMAVELESTSGAALQIKTGEKAELDFPLPESMQGFAPASIPLWYYNMDNGYWVEESVASLTNGRYVGQVNHFSYWNCDAPFPVVNFEARLVNEAGEPLPEIRTFIKIVSSGKVGFGISDSEGVIKGKVPSEEALELQILTDCNDVVQTIALGPYSADANAGDIVIDGDLGTSFFANLTGSLVNCDGNPVTDGTVVFNGGMGKRILDVQDDGTFSMNMLMCSEGTISYIGYDYTESLASDELTISVDAAGDYDLGVIEVCEEVEVGIVVTSDYPFSQNFIVYTANSWEDDTYINVSGYGQDSTSININIPLPSSNYVGEVMSHSVNGYDQDLEVGYGVYNPVSPITITENGGAGGKLQATYTGKILVTKMDGTSVETNGTIELNQLDLND